MRADALGLLHEGFLGDLDASAPTRERGGSERCVDVRREGRLEQLSTVTLTETPRSMPHPRHIAHCRTARGARTRLRSTISRVCAASGTNDARRDHPLVGWRQRTSASTFASVPSFGARRSAGSAPRARRARRRRRSSVMSTSLPASLRSVAGVVAHHAGARLLRAYIATSARRTSWPTSSRRSGPIAMPTLASTETGMSWIDARRLDARAQRVRDLDGLLGRRRGRARPRTRRRRACDTRPSPATSTRRRAISRRSSSPASWPSESLTSLKRSRSISRTATCSSRHAGRAARRRGCRAARRGSSAP